MFELQAWGCLCDWLAPVKGPVNATPRMPVETDRIQDIACAIFHGCSQDEALAPHDLTPEEWAAALEHPDVQRCYLSARRNIILEYGRAAGLSRPVDTLERRAPDVWGRIDRTEVGGSVSVKLVGGIPEPILRAAAERAKRLKQPPISPLDT